MGRKSRELDANGGPVQAFAAELRALRDENGMTFDQMARKAHRSKTALTEAAGGVKLPTWETTEEYVKACGATADLQMWRDRWCRARTARDAGTDKADPDETLTPPAVAIEDTPPGSDAHATHGTYQRPWEIRGRNLAASAALLLVVVTVLGVVYRAGRTHESARVTPSPLPTLALQSPAALDPGRHETDCVPSAQWDYRFDANYRGQAYVQVASVSAEPVQATVTLSWGPWRWQRSLTIGPGLVSQYQGGTLLLFSKDKVDSNPGIIFNSTVPVCAVFGTAKTDQPAPRSVVDTRWGWRKVDSSA